MAEPPPLFRQGSSTDQGETTTTASMRPRNRRQNAAASSSSKTGPASTSATSLLTLSDAAASDDASSSNNNNNNNNLATSSTGSLLRGASPIPAARVGPTSPATRGSSSLGLVAGGGTAGGAGARRRPSPPAGGSGRVGGDSTAAFSRGLLWDGGSSGAGGGGGGGGGGWGAAVPSWAAVSGFASSLLSGANQALTGADSTSSSYYYANGGGSRDASTDGRGTRRKRTVPAGGAKGHRPTDSWGPEPPPPKSSPGRRPRIEDVAAGTEAKREAALRAARTASLLEGAVAAEGGWLINDGLKGDGGGGLGVAAGAGGRAGSVGKRRISGEETRGGGGGGGGSGVGGGGYDDGSGNADGGGDDGGDGPQQLVYIHHVAPSDTYAGVLVRYRVVREDAFRRANGLWSRDALALVTRKWLAVPVDACAVVGRPCDPPAPDDFYAGLGGRSDLLAPTPDARPEEETSSFPRVGSAEEHHDALHGDFFSLSLNGKDKQPQHRQRTDDAAAAAATPKDHQPWTHVRWVTVDGFPRPVEVGRVSTRAMGFFRPRRRKSLLAASTRSTTPRQSFDLSAETGTGITAGVTSAPLTTTTATGLEGAGTPTPGSPGSSGGGGGGLGRAATMRRHSSLMSADHLSSSSSQQTGMPRWMRRPGGVGSLTSKTTRAPGPERDALNSFTARHFPGLLMDAERMPSMSVMGAESATFGFGGAAKAGGAVGGAAQAGQAQPRVEIVESPSLSLGRELAAREDGIGGGGGGGGAFRAVAAAQNGHHHQGGKNTGQLLDRAASAIEHWARAALAGGGGGAGATAAGTARRPATPVLAGRRTAAAGLDDAGDLIELRDSNSDDGRWLIGAGAGGDSRASQQQAGSSSLSSGRTNWDGAAAPRGRLPPSSGQGSKAGKAD